MKFLDLFAGIGGFRLGLEQAGHECVGFCEIDKFARKSYKAIHNTEGEREYHDITTVSNEEWKELQGKVDIICGGFPCQAFSIAGKRKGFLDETRGTLFFEIARAAEQIKPRTLFLENVRGLLSHDKGRTFRTILSTLDELGYDAEWQILNSKNFGVPQNRERVFIIGHLRGERGREVFPIRCSANEATLKYIGGFKTGKLWLDNGKSYSRNFPQGNRVYHSEGLSCTLSSQGGGLGAKTGLYAIPVLDTYCNQAVIVQKPRGYNKGREHEVAPTLSSNSCHENNLLKSGIRIRKLTPRECWRLQGFPDSAFDKAQEVNSNSQLYKQAGNSVTVPVIYEIAKRLE